MFVSQPSLTLSNAGTVGLLILFLILFFVVLFVLALLSGRLFGLTFSSIAGGQGTIFAKPNQ
jgi:uncharacterized membrane protein